ncbi:hypothetical protein LJC20_05135 [Eubacteriales bacterium OttesenSCG-928-M02]|nr:hypothetical protein [Eubacteriales bacterium OttesenSCG-928-M02]
MEQQTLQQYSTLRIPSGIKTKTEIFSGFGFHELIEAGTIALILCGLCGIAFLFHTDSTSLVVSCLVSISASVGMCTKDKYNQSLLDQMKNLWQFTQSQRVYPYQYKREWVG